MALNAEAASFVPSVASSPHSNYSKSAKFIARKSLIVDLCKAAAEGDLQRCKDILEPCDTDPDYPTGFELCNSPQKSGLTALHYAASRGHPLVTSVLLESGAMRDFETPSGENAFLLASLNGHLDVMKLVADDPDTADQNGWNALHNSCSRGYLSIVQWLCEELHADVNAANKDGYTPLMSAAGRSHYAIVQYLIHKQRAHPFRRTSAGETALSIAAASFDLHTVTILSKYEEDWWADHSSDQLYTPLSLHTIYPIIVHELESGNAKNEARWQLPSSYSGINSTSGPRPCTLADIQLPSISSPFTIALCTGAEASATESSHFWLSEWQLDTSSLDVSPISGCQCEIDGEWQPEHANAKRGPRRRRWLRLLARRVDINPIGFPELDEKTLHFVGTDSDSDSVISSPSTEVSTFFQPTVSSIDLSTPNTTPELPRYAKFSVPSNETAFKAMPKPIVKRHTSTTSSLVLIQTPEWQSDRDARKCGICKSTFNFMLRKSHCRKCGKVVCRPCSSNQVWISEEFVAVEPGTTPKSGLHRVCDRCIQEERVTGRRSSAIGDNPSVLSAETSSTGHIIECITVPGTNTIATYLPSLLIPESNLVGTDCTICFTPLKPDTEIGRTDCMCVFHIKCVKAYVLHELPCPTHH